MLVELRNVASAARHERLPVDLLELTRTIAEQLSDVAEIRAVHIRIEPGSSPTLVADAAQIKQVLLNLINNAIDAAAETSNGIVSIRCCHDGTTIEIEVNDNGMGIASEIAGHVFEPFQTTKPRGMGLGLSLSQQIVEAHGGKLWWEFGGSARHAIPSSTSVQWVCGIWQLSALCMSSTTILPFGSRWRSC